MVSFVVQSVQFEKPGRTMATIAGTVLAVAYVGLLGSFIIQMRWFDGPFTAWCRWCFLIATAKGADTGAYTLGRLAGRHKLWPQPQPEQDDRGGRRRAGLRGGWPRCWSRRWLVSCSACPTLATGRRPSASAWSSGVAAQLGDLMESMIKRDCERKDASAAVPGFGGVLDVLDSLLFAGPVAYGFWLGFGPEHPGSGLTMRSVTRSTC